MALLLTHFFRVTVNAFYLLQEDGVSRIILEDGSGFLKLESSP